MNKRIVAKIECLMQAHQKILIRNVTKIIVFKISKNEWRIIPLDYMLILSMEWRRRVMVITTAQLHSTNPELRFCAGSNPARGVLEIRDCEDL